MTINGLNSTASLAYLQAGSRSQTQQQPAGDQVSMSISPDTFSDLVSTAKSMPDVRMDLVDTYKAQVEKGQYPSQDVMEGLINLMGGSWTKAANSGGSAAQS